MPKVPRRASRGLRLEPGPVGVEQSFSSWSHSWDLTVASSLSMGPALGACPHLSASPPPRAQPKGPCTAVGDC